MAKVLKALHLPISSAVMRVAVRHPMFCRTIINIFQANQCLITSLERRVCDQSASITIPPLNEEKVVQAASDFIGELFVFSVAGGVLIFSKQKKARLEARKNEIYKQEVEARKQKIDDMACKVEEHKERLAYLVQGVQSPDEPTGTELDLRDMSSLSKWITILTNKLKMWTSTQEDQLP